MTYTLHEARHVFPVVSTLIILICNRRGHEQTVCHVCVPLVVSTQFLQSIPICVKFHSSWYYRKVNNNKSMLLNIFFNYLFYYLISLCNFKLTYHDSTWNIAKSIAQLKGEPLDLRVIVRQLNGSITICSMFLRRVTGQHVFRYEKQSCNDLILVYKSSLICPSLSPIQLGLLK